MRVGLSASTSRFTIGSRTLPSAPPGNAENLLCYLALLGVNNHGRRHSRGPTTLTQQRGMSRKGTSTAARCPICPVLASELVAICKRSVAAPGLVPDSS